MNYIDAICELSPMTEVSTIGDGTDYGALEYHSGPSIPTQEELDLYIVGAIKLRVWLTIKAERDRRKTSGIKVGTNWFHSDADSRIQQLGLVIMGAGMPTGIMWKTLGGSFVEMTPVLAGQIFQATATSDTVLFATAEAKRTAMEASADPSVYDIYTGWPEAYS